MATNIKTKTQIKKSLQEKKEKQQRMPSLEALYAWRAKYGKKLAEWDDVGAIRSLRKER